MFYGHFRSLRLRLSESQKKKKKEKIIENNETVIAVNRIVFSPNYCENQIQNAFEKCTTLENPSMISGRKVVHKQKKNKKYTRNL